MSIKHNLFCIFRLHPAMIAVGSDDPNPANGSKVFIYEYNENSRRWTKTETIPSVCDPVHDIAFAPNLGRSYHLLAVATKDVRIIMLKPKQYVFSKCSTSFIIPV